MTKTLRIKNQPHTTAMPKRSTQPKMTGHGEINKKTSSQYKQFRENKNVSNKHERTRENCIKTNTGSQRFHHTCTAQ